MNLKLEFFFWFHELIELSLSICIFVSKIDSTPSKFIRIKRFYFLKCSSRKDLRSYGTSFFNFTFVRLKIFAINLPIFCFFSVHFSDKFLVKWSKTIVYLKRAHFFLSEYIYFYFLRFGVLEIIDFKVFDFIEKMNENATLNLNISKTIQGKSKKKDIF